MPVDPSKTAKCVVTVAQWITEIRFEKSQLTMLSGLESETLSVHISPDNAYNKTLNTFKRLFHPLCQGISEVKTQ